MSPTFDPDQVQGLAANAPEAGLAPVNYGKLSITANILHWDRAADGVATPVRRELKRGEQPAKGETLELLFEVDVQELNPGLQFTYTRTVSVLKTSPRLKSDWTEIVEPSLIATFGTEWAKHVARGPYVEVEDVPNVAGKTSKTTGKAFGVPKFLRKFANAAECQKAREDRFGAGAATAAQSAPISTGMPPDSVVNQVRNLVKSVGGPMTRKMLDEHPFGDFDADLLFGMASVAKA